ncbi:serine/threonine protein phosphatase [Rhizobium oryzihabitans]|jgi:serine/threonine protein phosphatase 1|uniref:Serine/threonine protein phosphatase n=1 Tax=Rhizobium oryzihabitans TaxID=2267833 RepID=A0A7L5BNB5_9HYPH|nr:metallophosphoesterase family protein [Rhizobium oryzihabitans]MCW0980861.1 serine/threonine protein phosphatase [Agrobacterium sp. BT-220-3]QCM07109.1 serine/threonine protein phosphatase [Agrobacterium tumefaciens]QIB40106.1 serine/threonine protein phosphatase [Rhizobium oryzihabitans]CUX61578.1 Serine/threonine protein phosphatase I [Agrobacterium genomosp. 5 str. CFBP 6626]
MPKVFNWIRGRKQPAPRDDRRRRRLDLGDRPVSFPIYAIGDVHGSLDLLLQAERKILADMAGSSSPALVILLGDYVDRGRDSCGVLQHLLQPPPAPLRRIALCGNHEQLFSDFLENPQDNMHWLDFGGRQTLLSYGVDIDYFLHKGRLRLQPFKDALIGAVPQTHRQLLSSLPIYARIGPYIFVHAGLRPGIPLEMQTDEDMLWIREPFLSEGAGLDLLVIHGHTPVAEPESGPQRIGIDTGAFTTGRLTVLKLSDAGLYLI